MSLTRVSTFACSETMSVPMFHFVQQQMEKYHDMAKMEKKRPWPWVRRLHLGLRAYKELLQSLAAMGHSATAGVRESAQVLKGNIFYVPEYREFILATFLGYDETKMPRCVLRRTAREHSFVRSFERSRRQVVLGGFGGDGAPVPEDAGALLQENGTSRSEESQEEGEK